jgi:GNAT superfamily N-acetyltransferase
MSSTNIRLATSEQDIRRCYPTLHQLRPNYSEAAFVEQVKKQIPGGYQLAFIELDGTVHAVAGFRYLESLAWGTFLYVDDLVSGDAVRGQGFAGKLMDWLIQRARTAGCKQLHLDSGVQRFNAHRFYFAKGMNIKCHHFEMSLDQVD